MCLCLCVCCVRVFVDFFFIFNALQFASCDISDVIFFHCLFLWRLSLEKFVLNCLSSLMICCFLLQFLNIELRFRGVSVLVCVCVYVFVVSVCVCLLIFFNFILVQLVSCDVIFLSLFVFVKVVPRKICLELFE